MAAQKVSAVNIVDIAYTSPSTAENQTEEVKAVAKPVTKPENDNATFSAVEGSSLLSTKNNLPNNIVIWAIKTAANEVQNADIRLIANAMSDGLSETNSATQVNNRPIIKNSPAPGG